MIDELGVIRILAVTGLVSWLLAGYFVTYHFARALWLNRQRGGEPLPFLVWSVLLGAMNVFETALTVIAVFQIETFGKIGLYALLLSPILRAIGFVTLGRSVLRR